MMQRPGEFSEVKPAGLFQAPKPTSPEMAEALQSGHFQRRERARELRRRGLSLRAIADQLGVSHQTVTRDLAVTVTRPVGRREPVIERVKIERGTGPLWTDEHGNLFRDQQLLEPIGFAACRTTTRVVDAD
jgi:lambda repressor-like predicted transcriptional regulator